MNSLKRNHELRDPKFRADISATLSKMGISPNGIYDAAFGSISTGQNSLKKGDVLEARNSCKRAINTLTDDAKKSFDTGSNEAGEHALSQAENLSKLVAQLDDQMSNFEFLNRNSPGNTDGETTVLRSAADYRAHYNKLASNEESRFTFIDWMRGVANMQTTPEVRNTLSVGTDTAGGFSVPSLVMPGILEALAPASSLLTAGVGIVPMEVGAKTMNYPAVNALPVAAWRSEGGAVAESDPTFRNVQITPRSLAFRFKISRELLADSVGMNDALVRVIAQAFAKELDRAGLRGSGSAPEPRGLLNTAGIQTVGNGANGAALANYSNFFSAAQAILQADAPMPTAAIMSPRSLVKLGGLLDTTNQPLSVPPMLQNMTMVATSQIPNNLTVGTSTDCSEIYIGDYSRMLLVMRENVTIQLLNEAHATTGEIGFIGHVRADFAVQYPQAFAVATGVRA
jgi:HK97 family phage major capsid protein